MVDAHHSRARRRGVAGAAPRAAAAGGGSAGTSSQAAAARAAGAVQATKLPRQPPPVSGASRGTVIDAATSSPVMSPKVTVIEARCTAVGKRHCMTSGSPGWATAMPAARRRVPV